MCLLLLCGKHITVTVPKQPVGSYTANAQVTLIHFKRKPKSAATFYLVSKKPELPYRLL